MIKPNVAQLNQYTYNAKLLRYTNITTGRIVSAQEVRNAVDTVIDKEALRLQNVAQALVDGKIHLAEWQIQTSTLLKNLHVAMGLAASGGLKNTSASDMGYIANQIKEQYKFLRNFALQIKRGDVTLDATLVARVGMYAQASRATYENTLQRRARAAGLRQEKSVLGEVQTSHCGDCQGEAGKEWVEIGSLIPIGQRSCRGNCKCHFIYRAGEDAA
jgi:hypothetical protein